MLTPLSDELREFVQLAYAVAEREHWHIGGFISAVTSAWHDRQMKVPHDCKLGCTVLPLDHLSEGATNADAT